MRAYRKYILTLGLVWGGAIVLFVAAYALIIGPQVKERNRLIAESAKKQKAYESAIDASKEETKKKLADEVEQLKNLLNDYAVDFGDSANITLGISRIAADKQVAAFTVKASEQSKNTAKTDAKSLNENRIEISFVSDFGQFLSFINILERHHPVVFVDRFKILRGNDGPASNKVDMDLSIFVRKRPEG